LNILKNKKEMCRNGDYRIKYRINNATMGTVRLSKPFKVINSADVVMIIRRKLYPINSDEEKVVR